MSAVVAHGLPYNPIGRNLGWARVYWVNGPVPRGSRLRNDETNPPTSGWSSCFVMDPGPTARYATLFCPFAFTSHRVSKEGLEWFSLQPVDFNRAFMELYLPEQWASATRFGFQRAFDQAASVMRALDVPVPTTSSSAKNETEVRGGKEVGSKLKKPVKRKSRRGEVLAFYLEQESRSVREGVAEFGITRSNLLSQLYCLQKDHGVGYAIIGESVRITLPEGCSDPFVE